MTLRASFQACRALTRHHAKSFYFSSHTLPAPTRRAAYAIYAYCRHVDDTVDCAPDPTAVADAVAQLRAELDRRHFPHAWGPAFLDTVERHAIPWHYFQELLAGVTLDQGPVRIQTWPELERYCYLVASVVGLMMTHLFLRPWPELLTHAKHLGTAMQLTNILRDVAEDYARGRIYLPEQELSHFGVTEEMIRRGEMNEPMRALIRFQIQRARDYYTKSEPGIVQLPRDGCQLTVWMMREIYAGILDEIERRDLQIFSGRARTSTWRKVQLAGRAWRRYRSTSAG